MRVAYKVSEHCFSWGITVTSCHDNTRGELWQAAMTTPGRAKTTRVSQQGQDEKMESGFLVKALCKSQERTHEQQRIHGRIPIGRVTAIFMFWC